MAGTTRLELATSAVTVSNGVGGHLLIPQDTRCHFLSSPYCTQIWPSYASVSMTRANDASVSFSRELRAGKRIEFDERLSGYEIHDHSLSPIDSVALTIIL